MRGRMHKQLDSARGQLGELMREALLVRAGIGTDGRDDDRARKGSMMTKRKACVWGQSLRKQNQGVAGLWQRFRYKL